MLVDTMAPPVNTSLDYSRAMPGFRGYLPHQGAWAPTPSDEWPMLVDKATRLAYTSRDPVSSMRPDSTTMAPPQTPYPIAGSSQHRPVHEGGGVYIGAMSCIRHTETHYSWP